MTGKWNIKPIIGSLPEKLATAFAALKLDGTEYTPIAYIAEQVVNVNGVFGVNHAVLAEQLVTVEKDVKNIVLMIFHEKSEKFTLVNIERVLERWCKHITVETGDNINKTAMRVFEKDLDGDAGSVIAPFAYLGDKVVRDGTEFYFVCEAPPVIDAKEGSNESVVLVSVNDFEDGANFKDILK